MNRFLWWCLHQWETVDKYEIQGHNANTPKAVIYVLKCKHCGNIKTKKIKD